MRLLMNVVTPPVVGGNGPTTITRGLAAMERLRSFLRLSRPHSSMLGRVATIEPWPLCRIKCIPVSYLKDLLPSACRVARRAFRGPRSDAAGTSAAACDMLCTWEHGVVPIRKCAGGQVRVLRTIVQAAFMAGVVALLVRGLTGGTTNTCETYCPFGGLVAIPPLRTHRAYSCTLSELNVALLVSLVILTLATKKSFCSWICPLGAIQEWVGRGGRKVFGRYMHLPAVVDKSLMPLRYAVLVGVLILTYTVWGNVWGEGPVGYDLGFRAYCWASFF